MDDKRRDREKREAVLKVLDEQVRQVQVRRLEEARLRQAEIAELQATWAKMAAEQEAAEAEEREAMRRLAAELQEFNRIKQMEISEAERQERWAGVCVAAAYMVPCATGQGGAVSCPACYPRKPSYPVLMR